MTNSTVSLASETEDKTSYRVKPPAKKGASASANQSPPNWGQLAPRGDVVFKGTAFKDPQPIIDRQMFMLSNSATAKIKG